jgi:hypothetical protein
MATLKIFADYYQIYLCDPAHTEDWASLWTDQTVDDRIVALAHTVVFGTGRNMVLPVTVSAHDTRPNLDQLVAKADHAVTGDITCASGQLNLAGCTDYVHAFAITMAKGPVGVAFLSFDLGTIDPVGGLDGTDRYELHVWPEATLAPSPQVLRRWKV